MNEKCFGHMSDGTAVRLYKIGNDHMTVSLTDLGASLVSCVVDGRDVALGYDTAEEYLRNAGSMGATVGRYANRIRDGRFTLHGRTYQLPRNRPPHCLHGGQTGFDRKLWRVTRHSAETVTFQLFSPDGDQGFPGSLTATAVYAVKESTLSLTYTALSDADTVCSLANHTYWNLAGHAAGHAALENHVFTVPSILRCELDDDTVPTGKLCPVEGTVFDLRCAVRLGDVLDDPALRATRGFDHPYALAGDWAWCASARCAGMTMEMWTDTPCMQVYTGNGLPRVAGKGGAQYGPQTGFCFETQQFPDAPNCPSFPTATLRGGEEKRYRTEYRFIKS